MTIDHSQSTWRPKSADTPPVPTFSPVWSDPPVGMGCVPSLTTRPTAVYFGGTLYIFYTRLDTSELAAIAYPQSGPWETRTLPGNPVTSVSAAADHASSGLYLAYVAKTANSVEVEVLTTKDGVNWTLVKLPTIADVGRYGVGLASWNDGLCLAYVDSSGSVQCQFRNRLGDWQQSTITGMTANDRRRRSLWCWSGKLE